ncbi:MAG: imidazoleglycerol-phosphate dehydratase HisB [Spirochaetales bacterium]|uniref:Imidazoleglycerol-phosphate dehydratase n=1 Tax=Candidatus Thalassospirochaeta sargassi TaxID=3119039 RepID=A0AAJ1IHU2_9SPIO|nr:imidazoleglycerol-phosphate dehydratase HisB [Spirochaetales bacterium]
MEPRKAEITRNTKETRINIKLDLDSSEKPEINTGLPFFDHILYSMSFHGGFFLRVDASGDIEVDPHHLVEDTGLVLGDAFKSAAEKGEALVRFGHAIIPMDDSLAEATIDACGRPFLVYRAEYPQENAGTFYVFLLKEFLKAFSDRAGLNLHLECRYGENSHHMAEALFKSMGKALGQAYKQASNGEVLSTKGTLSK